MKTRNTYSEYDFKNREDLRQILSKTQPIPSIPGEVLENRLWALSREIRKKQNIGQYELDLIIDYLKFIKRRPDFKKRKQRKKTLNRCWADLRREDYI
jgi:hypothetical protein